MAEKPTYDELAKTDQIPEMPDSRLKQTEHALKASEAYLRTLIRTIPDLVWFKDPQGIFLFCNSRFESFFGAREEEIVGKTDYDLVDKDQADFFRMHDDMAIAKGKPSKNEEKVFFLEDGHSEVLETIKTPVFKDDGKLLGVLCIGRDITGRKQAESERLANLYFFESLDRVNQAMHGSNDLTQVLRDVLDLILSIFGCDRAFLLCPCDPDAEILDVPMERNRPEYPGAFELGFSVPATESIKETFKELLSTRSVMEKTLGKEIDPEQEPWKKYRIQSLLSTALFPTIGKPWCLGLHQCAYARQWTDREKTLFQEVGRRIADSLTSLLMYRDLEKMVDERTEQLKTAQEELVKKEKLSVLGQLTTVVSHELRNPLGVIRTSNFYLQRRLGDSDEKIDKHLKRIDQQVSHCDAIVADLLEYTRGRITEITTKNIEPWLTGVVNQTKEQTDVDIELHVGPNLPPVPHDQEKMQRVVINLLTNAIQAVNARTRENQEKETPSIFTPRIRIEVETDGNHLFIRISDNGTGMTPPTRQHAFDPLFTTRARGTGIGLAIVRKTIEAHGGHIDLKTHEGEGTQFTLTLPCVPENVRA